MLESWASCTRQNAGVGPTLPATEWQGQDNPRGLIRQCHVVHPIRFALRLSTIWDGNQRISLRLSALVSECLKLCLLQALVLVCCATCS